MIVLIATMLVIIALAERQRRTQDAAERVRAQLAAIVESMSDAVMVVDAAGRATNVNHAAIAMLGAADRRGGARESDASARRWDARDRRVCAA